MTSDEGLEMSFREDDFGWSRVRSSDQRMQLDLQEEATFGVAVQTAASA